MLLLLLDYVLLYSEIVLSWKLFGIGHMHTYTFLFRVTNTVTSTQIGYGKRFVMNFLIVIYKQ
jgi:hypothetical protein